MDIIAHRGASHDAPENTLAAVRLAWEQAADAVEVDVHLTQDGRLAVIHDPDTQRTAGVRRVVASTTLAELQTLDVGRWVERCFAGERIPALDEMLALVPAGKRVFVETKGGAETVAELTRCVGRACGAHHGQRGQVVIISFDLAGAAVAKRALPKHEVGWIVEAGEAAPFSTLDEIVRVAREAGLDGIDVEAAWALDRACVQQIQRSGLKVYVWTVDDPAVARNLAAAGVDGVTTNRPGWLRAQLGRVE